MASDLRQRKFAGEHTEYTADDIRLRHQRDLSEDVPADTGLLMLCKITLGLIIGFPLIVLTVLAVMPNRIDPVAYSLPDPPKLIGPLQANRHLVSAQKLYEGKLVGPESIIHRHGHLYTGTADGKILHIENGVIETVAELGKPPCGLYQDEPTCGRPLGMRFDKNGYLIVADAYLGFHKVNVATGDVDLMFPATTMVDNRPLTFINDFDIAANGDIYFSDSSKYQRRDFSLDILEGRGSGRLLKYTQESSRMDVLLEGLHFANGVQVSKNNDYLLVAETAMFRITKYHLTGRLQGQSEVFIDNLPGSPDNIRRSESGGYWVGCGACRHAHSWSTVDALAQRPWARSLAAKLPQWLFMSLLPSCGIVLEIDQSGQIVQSLMDLDGHHLSHISEVEEDNGILYLGSFIKPYIAKINYKMLRKQ